MERDFKGVWIPAEIHDDENLSLKEKLYLSVYNWCLSHETTAQILSSVYSSGRIRCARSLLIKKGYIKKTEKVTAEAAKAWVIDHRFKGFKCEWCGQPCMVLQKHHFPVSRSRGGKKTVDICPNCHYTYHAVFKEDQDGNIQGQQE